MYKGSLCSIGNKSDAFLEMLAKAYGVQTTGLFSKNPIFYRMLPREDKDFDIEKRTIRTKIFLEKPEKYHSELFLNFDIPNGYSYFNEKDQEYRKNIILVLQGST